MLLNLTNHPSSIWNENQIIQAKDRFGTIQDLPFPQIDPNASEEEIENLAKKYTAEIKKFNPNAVHIMGEQTFSYKLISRLKTAGIRCIASTTRRQVTEDENGQKISKFNFVKFREY